jgi:hypothetical protein
MVVGVQKLVPRVLARGQRREFVGSLRDVGAARPVETRRQRRGSAESDRGLGELTAGEFPVFEGVSPGVAFGTVVGWAPGFVRSGSTRSDVVHRHWLGTGGGRGFWFARRK